MPQCWSWLCRGLALLTLAVAAVAIRRRGDFGPRPSSPPPTRSILIDTPLTPFVWNAEIVNERKSGVGLSGTHTTLLLIAEHFAASGWRSYLTGSVSPTNSSAAAHGVEYLDRDAQRQLVLQKRPLDVAIVADIFNPGVWGMNSAVFSQIPTRVLCVLMEQQWFAKYAARLRSYALAQRKAQRGNFTVVLAHLSPWGQRTFKKWAVGSHDWMTHRWVRHVQFRNPIDESLIREAKESMRGLARNERSFIFPACLERGGVVAARVFRLLKGEWGETARATWAFYDPNGGGEVKRITEAAGANDSRVAIRRLSKPALMAGLQGAGFFVYACVSSSGRAHYDTFSNAVAESLASGVLVLAPPIGALPSLYSGLVTFVEPPGGLPAAVREAWGAPPAGGLPMSAGPRTVPELQSSGMVDAYVRAIQALMANATRRTELRQKGISAMHKRFSAARVTSKLHKVLRASL